jgi:CDP-diglyceride synthetase
VLALGLPPQTFYAGDPGVKLIAARHAIAEPGNPFQIPLPEIAGEPAPFVDRFFLVHDDHSHAVLPELFPLLSAPFIALLGLRGAYVLPAAGLLLAIAATAWLGLLLDRRRSPVALVLTTFLGTPLLFYGLEFWEHAPAVGVAMLATALLVQSASQSSSPARFAAVGLLFGIAALLRPEALWFGVAVLAASLLLRERPSPGRLGAATAGMVLPLALLELYTLAHFGHALPPHIAGNPGLLGGDWFAMRRTVSTSWFISQGRSNFWRVAPAVLLAFVWRPMSYFGAAARRGRRFLLVVAAAFALMVALTAPNDGGAQWGPRYLLLAYMPLAILATDTLAYVVRFLGVPKRTSRGGGKATASGARWALALLPMAAVASLAIGSAWLQRAAYKELRGSKLTYARMVDFVEHETAPGRPVVTDLWWLDQAAASLADSRRFFVVDDPEEAAEVVHRLSEAGEPTVTLIRHPVDSPGHYSAWLARSCYAFEQERGDGEGLIAIQVARGCNR